MAARWRSCVLGLVGLLLAGCAAHAPSTGVLRSSETFGHAAASWGLPPAASNSGSSLGSALALARPPVTALAQVPAGEAIREEDARGRARRVEEKRVEALVLDAWRDGREPTAAREAEADRATAHVLGLTRGVDAVGATLAFTFWAEEGALTLVGYREESGGGREGRPVGGNGLARVLRQVFADYVGRRTGEVVLRLRREDARWAVDYDASRQSPRPAEARALPVRTRGTAGERFLVLHETAGKWLRAVQVPAGGAMRVELVARLEDGRLLDWELLEVRRTREGTGGVSRPLSSEVAGHSSQVLLPFTEGLGSRTVHMVLRAEHRLGDADARGHVESAWVERPPPVPELSWYRSMHEAILLRWREDVHEGSAWLAQKGVEETALWFVGGVVAKGAGFFATKGLEWVPRALGREPEMAAGWLRTALRRLSVEEQAAFERLWRKMALEGEQAMSRGERETLRGLFVRLEQVIQQPLDGNLKKTLRVEARRFYAELHPQLAEVLDRLGEELPIHHRRPLQYAHLFPSEDINAAENLAMLPKYVHKEINLLWGRFRKARPNPTADDVRRAAEIIDGRFESWYHHAEESPGLLKATEDAREAALRELRLRFPGLE
ncbi:hypothetical protein JRI60_49345 [Archangium violaceum]|uniref:hypothetical protein n=1 Tax=Archangium violaceum TaxID=83451 RepID=UPI00194F58D3|nr:hypothetical protein [Archangium violaceum]QRN96894.1 hypothetical protein JRI60_49345 [Archangium violaceum]